MNFKFGTYCRAETRVDAFFLVNKLRSTAAAGQRQLIIQVFAKIRLKSVLLDPISTQMIRREKSIDSKFNYLVLIFVP
jgi:hypothetical protein